MSEHTQLIANETMPVVITADQAELVKNTVAKGATDDELRLFFYDCQRRGVHPLDRLIHFTVRTGADGVRKYTPIVGIDFMRMRAAESGELVGSDTALFEGEPKTPGFSATVTVYRLVQGMKCAFSGTARWSEFYPGDKQGMMWNKMPHNQLAKCAEAAALRKGFPGQLAEIYTREEMEQAEAPPAEAPLKQPQAKAATATAAPPDGPPAAETAIDKTLITEPQRKRLFAIVHQAGWKDEEFKAVLLECFQLDSTTKIKKDQYEQICELAMAGKPGTGA